MRRTQPLGLDELMIVNPGPSDPGTFFLDEDGTLYQVEGVGLNGLAERIDRSGKGGGEDTCCQHTRFFLGEDGTLYEVVR